jgi:DNA-binding transcriptional MerR regulator
MGNYLGRQKMALETMLRSIGKSTFVKYYSYFKDEEYSLQEIKHAMHTNDNYEQNSLDTKASCGRQIFHMHFEREALKNIIHSKRVEAAVRTEAEELLKQEFTNNLPKKEEFCMKIEMNDLLTIRQHLEEAVTRIDSLLASKSDTDLA